MRRRLPALRSLPALSHRIVAVSCAVLTAVLLSTSPARADVTPEAPGSTVSDVAAQTAATEALQRQAAAHTTEVARAQAGVMAASLRAGAALEAYTTAVRALNAAKADESVRQQAMNATAGALAENRAALGRWARSAYTGRDVLDGHGLMETVLSARTTDAISSDLVVLRRIGQERADVVDSFVAAQQQMDTVRAASEQAAVTAADAAVAAAAAKNAADTAVTASRSVLARAQGTLADTRQALADSTRRDHEAAATVTAASVANAVTGPVGDCAGGETASYANGQIPLSALCPLWGAPQHHLRADAANAFDQLSRAYDAAFGTPICITDSYRTYAAQVDLRLRKPTLAAVPGTSNHGWGTATDLCGGIQDFSSAQHLWMLANAPRYGWFHPAWAAAGGSKPEPWHWEFGG